MTDEQKLEEILRGTLVIGNEGGIKYAIKKLLDWTEKKRKDDNAVDYKIEYDQAVREIKELQSQVESLEGELRDANNNCY